MPDIRLEESINTVTRGRTLLEIVDETNSALYAIDEAIRLSKDGRAKSTIDFVYRHMWPLHTKY